jgi:hypothetical protein
MRSWAIRRVERSRQSLTNRIWPKASVVNRFSSPAAERWGVISEPLARLTTNRSCSASPTLSGGRARIRSCTAVSTAPGRNVLTVIPAPSRSTARLSVWASNAALDAGYAVPTTIILGLPTVPLDTLTIPLDTLTIPPQPGPGMRGMTAAVRASSAPAAARPTAISRPIPRPLTWATRSSSSAVITGRSRRRARPQARTVLTRDPSAVHVAEPAVGPIGPISGVWGTMSTSPDPSAPWAEYTRELANVG